MKFLNGEIIPQTPYKNFINYGRRNNIMRRRTIKKQLWLDTNENKLLKQKANKSGLTESEFLRSCIKGYKIKEQPTKEIREFTRDISGIANNINQIARAVNGARYIRDEDLEYIKKTIPQFILEFQKKVYSRE